MTGKDLIVYILANDLEDAPVFEDGKLLGFMTAVEAAAKFEVGVATIKVWINEGFLEGIKLGEEIYIPATTKRPELYDTEDKGV